MCSERDIETYSNSDGKKITKAEYEKEIKGNAIPKNELLVDELSKKVAELEDKLKKSDDVFDYVLKLLVEVLESLKPK